MSNDDLWFLPGEIVLFRSLASGVHYEADDPFPSPVGRFSNGTRLVIYLARSADIAISEWLRWHPEFLGMQEDLEVRMYSIRIRCDRRVLDVTTEGRCDLIPFPFPRLRSAETDPMVRYLECGELAEECENANGAGIQSPSAARRDLDRHNLTLFGAKGDLWTSSELIEVERPVVDPASIELVPAT